LITHTHTYLKLGVHLFSEKIIGTEDLPETGEREAEVKGNMGIEKTFSRSI
jgi:hypothetical protein